jgi:ribonucleoside-diphosphate reductase alpha chain
VLGKGEAQSELGAPAQTAAQQAVSKGLLRSKTDKLMLISGGAGAALPASAVSVSPAAPFGGVAAGMTMGATALKPEPNMEVTLTEAELAKLGFASAAPQSRTAADKRAEAIMKGYVGDSCGECGNFTLVRNGTCLKCDTCGSTTGCS